jgi:hypothetical protein
MKWRITFSGFDLAAIGNRVRIALPGVAAVVVSGWSISGTWVNALSVKRFGAGGDFDFASAKTVSASAPCALSSADLEAATGITIAIAANESSRWVDLLVEVEAEGTPRILEGNGSVTRVD